MLLKTNIDGGFCVTFERLCIGQRVIVLSLFDILTIENMNVGKSLV